MGDNPKSREHVTSVCLPVPLYLAINRLSAALEIGKHAAVLLAINDGCQKLGVVSQQDYDHLAHRYRRKLREIVAQNQIKPESSHIPVLKIEQEKEKELLEKKDKQFRGILRQWDIHPDPEWRKKVLAEAEKYKDKLESARSLCELKPQEGSS